MTFQQLCEAAYEELRIDPNLLAALMIAVVARRDFAVISRSPVRTSKYLKEIYTKLFGIESELIQIPHNAGESGSESKVPSYDQFGKAADGMMVIEGIQYLDPKVQAEYAKTSSWSRIFVLLSDSTLHKLDKGLRESFLFAHNQGDDEPVLPTVATSGAAIVSNEYLEQLRVATDELNLSVDVQRYMQDIIVFVRNHRLVRKGVSTRAVRDFNTLTRVIAVLHGYDFATPSLAAIAARKVLPLRIDMCEPRDEPSILYGGDVNLVAQWMSKWDQELIVEDVLDRVGPPI